MQVLIDPKASDLKRADHRHAIQRELDAVRKLQVVLALLMHAWHWCVHHLIPNVGQQASHDASSELISWLPEWMEHRTLRSGI